MEADSLNILLVEDDSAIARVLALELEHTGHKVTIAADGITGLKLALEGSWEIILLDIMLPHLNGYEICKKVREEKDTPILLLTAKDEVQDKVFGLNLGADDYLTKPFAMEELMARIKAVLRRYPSTPGMAVTRFEELVWDQQARRVTCRGQEVNLTKREFDLLGFFLEHPKHVLTREQILENIWGYEYYGDTNVVDVYVRFLRSKIDERFEVRYFHTVRGVGYVLRSDE